MSWIAEAPSNIAFIKYWGKRNALKQWPANDSISMSLTNCKTITRVSISDIDQMMIHGEEILNFEKSKQKKFLNHIRRQFNFTQSLRIETENTFPSSCGIASSASGYAALTIAAMAAFTGAANLDELALFGFPRHALADIARMGSGSACRSLFGGYVHWCAGNSPEEQIVTQIANQSWKLCDLIVVLSSEEKSVSSSDGHEAVWKNPKFEDRLKSISLLRLPLALQAIRDQSLSSLGPVIEEDAVNMHEISENSLIPIRYRSEKTLAVQEWVKNFRKNSGLNLYFTIDAGPNVHLICLDRDSQEIEQAVKETFSDATIIRDSVGAGPTLFIDG